MNEDYAKPITLTITNLSVLGDAARDQGKVPQVVGRCTPAAIENIIMANLGPLRLLTPGTYTLLVASSLGDGRTVVVDVPDTRITLDTGAGPMPISGAMISTQQLLDSMQHDLEDAVREPIDPTIPFGGPRVR